MNVSETKPDGQNDSVGTEITLSESAPGASSFPLENIYRWLTVYHQYLSQNPPNESDAHHDVGQRQQLELPWRSQKRCDRRANESDDARKTLVFKKRHLDRVYHSAGDRFTRRNREKPQAEPNNKVTVRKHPVQLLCEMYGKNGLQTECEFLCDDSSTPPARRQKVTYTVLGQKFTAVSHTRDEAKRLCARKALMTLHPELRDQLQEQIPRQEYDFGDRLNCRHPVDLVSYFARNEHVMMETEKKGLSHFTTYTVTYAIRGRKYVATAEKQNEAKRRCAIMVLNDIYKNSNFFNEKKN